MPNDTRMTVYLQPRIYRALKIKSATTDRSISELVNSAVIEALREDKVDLAAFDKRRKIQPPVSASPARPQARWTPIAWSSRNLLKGSCARCPNKIFNASPNDFRVFPAIRTLQAARNFPAMITIGPVKVTIVLSMQSMMPII